MCIHNTLYHSTIFKTTTDELGNTKLSINNGLKGLFSGDFFKKQSVLSDSDISALQAYNAEIKRGVSPATAYYRTLREASDAANNMAHAAGNATVNLEQIPKVSKAGQVALKGLAMAGNMLAMWAIGEVIGLAIEGLDNLVNSTEYAKERAEGFTSSIKEFQNEVFDGSQKISELSSKYNELADGVDNAGHNMSLTSEQYSEYKDVVSQLSDLMPTLNTTFNEQGEKIGFVEGKLKDVNKEYKEYLKNKASDYFLNGDENGNTFGDVLDTYNTSKNEKTNTWRQIGTGFLQGLVNGVTFGLADASDFGYNTSGDLTEKGQLDILEQFKNKTNNFSKDGFLGIKNKFTPDEIDYFEDIVGISVDDLVNANAKDFQTYQKQLGKKIESLKNNQETYWSQIRSGLVQELYTDDDYLNIEDSSLQGNISSFVSSLSSDIFDSLDIDPQNENAVRSYVDKITDLFVQNKDGFANAYSQLLSINLDELPVDDAKNKIQKFLTIIATGLGLDPKNGGVSLVQSMLGFDNWYTDVANQYDKVVAYASSGTYGSSKDVKGSKGFDQKDVIKEMSDNSINTKEELSTWNEILHTVNTLDEAVLKYKEDIGKNQEPQITKTFDSIWNSIGKEGDDKAKKTAQEAKEEILKLAEAGKLTEKAFEKSSIADTFTQAGYSIEKATKKVNSMVDSAKQLSSLKSSISSIQNAYQEKKDNKVVGADTLANMEQIFGKLKSWDNYKAVLGSTTSKLGECREAQNQLATEYVNSNNFLSQLTDKNKDYYISQLSELGIANAKSVVEKTASANKEVLKNKTEALAAATSDLSGKTNNASEEFLKEANMSNLAKVQLADLIAKEQIFNGQGINTTAKVAELNRLASAYFGVANAIQISSAMGSDPRYYKKPEDYSKAVQKQWNKLVNKQTKLSVEPIKVNPVKNAKNTSSSGSKGSKDSSKKEKTEINWLERRLTRMQSIIDLTASKLQNLFSVKAKNNNLDKQIKQTTKLMNQYKIAADRYMGKANSVAKASGKGKNKVPALSKDIIKKVKSGKITKASYSKLIKKYGQPYADKINSYIDYYDKAQDAKKNATDLESKIRGLKQDKLQTYVDKYNAKAALAETKAVNAVGYKKKNSYIATQLSYLNKSYQKQIAIAKLNEDTTEQARLQVEYEAKKVELQKQQIEHLKTEYDNRIGLIDNDEQNVNNTLSQMEARGQIIKSSYYSSLNKYENQKLSKLNSELKDLQGQQNTFTKYSQEWYDLQSDIQSVKNAINDAKVAIIENNKKVGELRQAMYDDIAERNSNVSTEANFLAGLLGNNLTDDKMGGLTKEGLAMLGTYGIDMEANSNTAKNRKAEREELEKLIASYKKGNSHALDAYGSLEVAEKKLSEIIQKQQDAISAEYANEKQIYDLMTQRYEAQLSYMQSIIEARKKELELEKDLYSYQRNIANQTQNIATLEKQLASLQGDTSEEGRAKLQKIQVSLDEANQELQDTEYERYISDQQDMLDNMYSQYEDLLHELEKDFEKVVQDGVNTINDTSKEISTTLSTYSSKYGYNPSEDMKSILNGLKVVTLPDSLSEGLSELGLIFKKSAQDIINAYNGNPTPNPTPDKDNSVSKKPQSSNNTSSNELRSEKRYNNDYQEIMHAIQPYLNSDTKNPKSDLNKLLKKHSNYVISSKNNDADFKNLAKKLGVSTKVDYSKNGAVYKYLKAHGFQTGGIVRANAPKTGDNVLVRVNPDETILTKKFTDILPQSLDIMENLTKQINLPDYNNLKSVSRNVGNTFGDIVINAELPNVKDSYDFVHDIQNNRKTQRAIEVSIKDCMSRGKITNNIQSIR